MKEFDELIAVVKKLRGPDGCPWDKEQTHESLIPYFLEETHEAIETIEDKELDKLRYELGDVLLHIVFQSVIAEENEEFTIADVLNGIKDKMINRHPHVFNSNKKCTAEEANIIWEKEKSKKRTGRILDGVPKSLPALHRSYRMQQKAASVGFNWDDVSDVWKKVDEEFEEFKEAHALGDKVHAEEEFGDILFALVNLARFYDIHPGEALKKGNEKFKRRFNQVEDFYTKANRNMKDDSLEELDKVWDLVKSKE